MARHRIIDLESTLNDVGFLERDSDPNVGLTIRWPALSLSLSALSLASVAALVIIATSKSADTLATVALVLAILSFAAQLIVTATQAHSSDKHYRDMTALSDATKHTLSKLDERMNAMVETQQGTFARLLDTVIDRGVTPDAIQPMIEEIVRRTETSFVTDPSGADLSTGEQEAEIARQVAEVLRVELKKSAKAETIDSTSTLSSSDRERLLTNGKQLFERAEALERLMAANPRTIKSFIDLVSFGDPKWLLKHSVVGSRKIGNYPQKDVPNWMNELSDLGLLEIVNVMSGESFVFLTARGADALGGIKASLDGTSGRSRLADGVIAKARTVTESEQ